MKYTVKVTRLGLTLGSYTMDQIHVIRTQWKNQYGCYWVDVFNGSKLVATIATF